MKLSFISELAFGRSKRNMVQLFYRGKVATSYEDDFDLSFFKDCKAIFQQMWKFEANNYLLNIVSAVDCST